jgi:acetyltransferase-like isoleucine patch superfamily enzyme
MLYPIFYPLIRLSLRLLVWAFSVELLNRWGYLLPGQLLVEMLRQYGAEIGEDVTFTPPVLFHNLADKSNRPFQNLSVGAHTYFGSDLFIDLKDRVIIGDHVTLAMGIMLLTHTDAAQSPLRAAQLPCSQGPIRIKSGAYVGARATILQGVTLGECSAVAAGAVVTEDVPPETLYGGVPARELKRFGP